VGDFTGDEMLQLRLPNKQGTKLVEGTGDKLVQTDGKPDIMALRSLEYGLF
jgi:hypothetical protein